MTPYNGHYASPRCPSPALIHHPYPPHPAIHHPPPPTGGYYTAAPPGGGMCMSVCSPTSPVPSHGSYHSLSDYSSSFTTPQSFTPITCSNNSRRQGANPNTQHRKQQVIIHHYKLLITVRGYDYTEQGENSCNKS